MYYTPHTPQLCITLHTLHNYVLHSTHSTIMFYTPHTPHLCFTLHTLHNYVLHSTDTNIIVLDVLDIGDIDVGANAFYQVLVNTQKKSSFFKKSGTKNTLPYAQLIIFYINILYINNDNNNNYYYYYKIKQYNHNWEKNIVFKIT